MTDRELLELAAKAAGYDVVFVHDNKIPMRRDVPNRKGMKVWNPLEDDGDALRLAVKLGMDIRIYGTDVRVACCGVIAMECPPDLYAATRRAITRAAAEIGRRVP